MTTFEYPGVLQLSWDSLPCQDGWCVYFPDFPGCISWGATLDEAKLQAKEALSLHTLAMMQDGERLPDRGVSFCTEVDDVVFPVSITASPATA